MASVKRLVLFDIDGTLMGAAGAGRRALKQAIEAVYGPQAHLDSWVFGGKTDPQIIQELLTHSGEAPEAIASRLPDLLEAYLAHLEPQMEATPAAHLKPGIEPLLDALAATPGVLLGLLTGNLERGARVKLARFGIDHHFKFGAYGSDSAVRRELPPVAVERARDLTGYHYRGKEIVIIGDTEHDIRCGEALGVRAIGVATGQYSLDELKPYGADHLFEDLADTERVLDAILREPVC
jgi:phosphoglycolate phosphatase-like HAD superfamily hydrolase